MSRGGKEKERVRKEYADDAARCHEVAQAIMDAINAPDASPVPYVPEEVDDDAEAIEGRVPTAVHRRRERNRKLVQDKKAKVMRDEGELRCEVCNFDFAEKYGERGAGFIECRHLRPVSEGVGQKTRLADLALVCANCHRMIHARRPWLTIEELRKIALATSPVVHRRPDPD